MGGADFFAIVINERDGASDMAIIQWWKNY